MRSSWIIKLGPKPRDRCPKKRNTEKRHSEKKGEVHVKMEAENGVMQPQAKEYLEPPVKEAKDSPQGPPEGTWTC